MMERRTFMTLVSGSLLAAPLARDAQQAGKIFILCQGQEPEPRPALTENGFYVIYAPTLCTHAAEGAAVKNQSAEVSHSPSRIENKRPPATGIAHGANLVDRTTSTLAATAP